MISNMDIMHYDQATIVKHWLNIMTMYQNGKLLNLISKTLKIMINE